MFSRKPHSKTSRRERCKRTGCVLCVLCVGCVECGCVGCTGCAGCSGCSGCSGARVRRVHRCDSGSVCEDAVAQFVDRGQRQHAQARFFLLSAAGFDAHFGHAEQAMNDVLDRIDVLDARERHVALVAEDQARSDHQLVVLVAKAERQVADDRGDRRGNEQHQQPRFPSRRHAAEPAPRAAGGLRGAEDDQHRRHGEVLGVLRQVKQQRRRMQPLLRRHRRPPMAAGARGCEARGRARARRARPWRDRCPRCR